MNGLSSCFHTVVYCHRAVLCLPMTSTVGETVFPPYPYVCIPQLLLYSQERKRENDVICMSVLLCVHVSFTGVREKGVCLCCLQCRVLSELQAALAGAWLVITVINQASDGAGGGVSRGE